MSYQRKLYAPGSWADKGQPSSFSPDEETAGVFDRDLYPDSGGWGGSSSFSPDKDTTSVFDRDLYSGSGGWGGSSSFSPDKDTTSVFDRDLYPDSGGWGPQSDSTPQSDPEPFEPPWSSQDRGYSYPSEDPVDWAPPPVQPAKRASSAPKIVGAVLGLLVVLGVGVIIGLNLLPPTPAPVVISAPSPTPSPPTPTPAPVVITTATPEDPHTPAPQTQTSASTPEPGRSYTSAGVLATARYAAEHNRHYSTVSETGAELEVPRDSDFLSTPFQMRAYAKKNGRAIYIIPKPCPDNGELGKVTHGELVTILAETDYYYFFVTQDGRAGWNGKSFFSAP